MPLYDYSCRSCGHATNDVYLPHWDSADPSCSNCGADKQERLVGAFAVPLSGSIHKYMDSKKEGADKDGFWAYRKVSSVGGQPEPVYIDSMDALRQFNKAEGLAAPGEAPTNASISADGKTILSDGMPGQWRGAMPSIPSGVWDMTKSLTSLKGKNPVPVASGPPCTVQAVDASLMEQFAAEAGG